MKNGFKQPCYIRKNTSELRKKLEYLGYVRDSPGEETEDAYPYLVCEGKYYWYAAEDAMLDGFIDCKDNEELFLAIVAMRNDTDFMQWFIAPQLKTISMPGYYSQAIGMDGHRDIIIGYTWIFDQREDMELSDRIQYRIQNGENPDKLPHKATVEELIEHFNIKQE